MKKLIALLVAPLIMACGTSALLAPYIPTNALTPAPSYATNPVQLPTLTQIKIVVLTVTNVREYADLDAGVVGYIYPGELVATDCVGDWCRVSSGWFCRPAALGAGGCEKR